ncbi:MAG: phosphocholine cytidylyltransferase family protein [Candidatus Symbiothrix sp.]|jgi:choline kinase|nr:phosphocholine cytidylyltransferase family protein [Candidatus Symbiothrix sp.]
MKAVILAAGTASRLRPLTDHTPKCLLEIGSKSLLQRTMDALLTNGIREIVIVTGYLHEKIESFVTSHYPALNVEFIHNERYESTNNIYSLWLTQAAVLDTDLLLLDSDILFDPAIIAALLDADYPACLALNKHALGEEEIKVIVDTGNRIQEISKTCAIADAAGESIGIEKMSNAFVRLLFAELDTMITEKQQVNIFYEAAFENVIRQGAFLYAIDTTRYFSMELDTVEDFLQAQKLIPVNIF